MEHNDDKPLRLLAVDDDTATAELIVRVAERCGYEAFATSDSRGVINLTEALKPDILAVDIQMPNIDAMGLFALLADAKFGGRILIISGQSPSRLEAAHQRAVNLGLEVPHVLQKPLDFGMLRTMLAAVLKEAQKPR